MNKRNAAWLLAVVRGTMGRLVAISIAVTSLIALAASAVGAAEPLPIPVQATCDTLSERDVHTGLGATPGAPVDATKEFPAWANPPNSTLGACRWTAATNPKVSLTLVYVNSRDATAFFDARDAATPTSRERVTVVPGSSSDDYPAVYWRGGHSAQNILVHDDAAVFQLITTSPKLRKAALIRLAYATVAALE